MEINNERGIRTWNIEGKGKKKIRADKTTAKKRNEAKSQRRRIKKMVRIGKTIIGKWWIISKRIVSTITLIGFSTRLRRRGILLWYMPKSF